jgi:hypothetical protein
MIEAICYSETSVGFHLSVWHYLAEDRALSTAILSGYFNQIDDHDIACDVEETLAGETIMHNTILSELRNTISKAVELVRSELQA